MSKKLRAWFLFLIFINGYASLALELVVIRQLGFYVGTSAIITSIIIGVILGFMSLGYFVGASNRVPRTHLRKIIARSFLIIAILGVLAASFMPVTLYFEIMRAIGINSIIPQTFVYSFAFLSVAPFLFGLNTAFMSRYLHKYNTNYTGNIMAWDTIGSVLGSLGTTLLLMPFVGVNWTIILLTTLSIFGAFIALPKLRVFIAGAVILIPAIWFNTNDFLLKHFGILVNNADSTISVMAYNEGTRVLYMNGLSMSIYNPRTDALAEYIEYVNNNFIYNLPTDKPREILILGAGGFTAGLNDKYHNYTFVDIERTLKDVSEKYFLGQKLSPNKKFIVDDASQFLKNTDNKYDVILLDVYSNSYSIPEHFITAEFMARLKSRVADNGVILLNVICSGDFSDEYTRIFDNTFHSVFSGNTGRQVIGPIHSEMANVVYMFFNRKPNDRIYTINKTPVIYDRK